MKSRKAIETSCERPEVTIKGPMSFGARPYGIFCHRPRNSHHQAASAAFPILQATEQGVGESALERGGIDILVNNAAHQGLTMTILGISETKNGSLPLGSKSMRCFI
jgi:hypothetical protein